MAHFIRFVWLFFLFFALLLSCKKPQPHEPQESICDDSLENMKDWYFFKTGSWWIYREENTGMVDTVTVYSYSESANHVYMFTHHTHDGYDIRYRYNSSWDRECYPLTNCTCKQINKSRTRPGDFVGDCFPFLYPIYEGNTNGIYGWVDDGEHWGHSVVHLQNQSFIIEEDTIGTPVRWDVDTDISMNGQPAVYYFIKNIGMVQMEYPDSSQVWKLYQWQVIQ
jgi:hypothetical protein